MPEIRCSQMDGFVQNLMEVNRRRERLVSRDHTAIELTYVCVDIARLLQDISDHRHICIICREVDIAKNATDRGSSVHIELAAANRKYLTTHLVI